MGTRIYPYAHDLQLSVHAPRHYCPSLLRLIGSVHPPPTLCVCLRVTGGVAGEPGYSGQQGLAGQQGLTGQQGYGVTGGTGETLGQRVEDRMLPGQQGIQVAKKEILETKMSSTVCLCRLTSECRGGRLKPLLCACHCCDLLAALANLTAVTAWRQGFIAVRAHQCHLRISGVPC